jgi:hypothetical protein
MEFETIKTAYENTFKDEVRNLIDILDEVIDNVSEYNKTSTTPAILSITKFNITTIQGLIFLYNSESIIRTFIEKSSVTNSWHNIASRNIQSVKTSFELFQGIDQKYLEEIASLFDNDKIMTSVIKDRICDILINMVKISIRYIDHCRVKKFDSKKGRSVYTVSCFDNIKIKPYIELFHITN